MIVGLVIGRYEIIRQDGKEGRNVCQGNGGGTVSLRGNHEEAKERFRKMETDRGMLM